ncbi:MAG TPA: ABC transporter ATP-binding protein [Terriglobia bacterium]|nr:ABC transporter ATP-binding protein [Terriglobia bacterium]
MGKPVVEIQGLSKIFKRDSFEIPALENINLVIEEGEFLCLMGPSGSGKTTLLNIIAGIDRPTSGELRVLNEDVARVSEDRLAAWRNAHVGFVFQTFNLIPVLDAYENVELPLLLTKLSAEERRKHVLAALNLVGLGDRIHHYPRQLSGGQEQRVAIARAIVTDPTLLMADEPTGDLDAQSAEEVLDILSRLNRDYKKTIVMVTHDPHAARHATITRHLEKGRLLPLGSEAMNEQQVRV